MEAKILGLSRLESSRNQYRAVIAGLLIVLAILFVIYLPTLQTIINGSSDAFAVDSGEIQIVLNTWGTLHATGYPLFTIQGNLLVALMKSIGISLVAAPSLVSLLWGIIALGLIYGLAWHLTRRIVLAAMITFLFGLTRFVWVPNVIPREYSFGLAIFILLFIVALWQADFPHRLEWLAFLGGLGIAHHRGLVLAIPPIIYAVMPQLIAAVRRKPSTLIILLGFSLLGFVPYIYLPLRASAGAPWVYGQPGTWSGFWDQFFAREVSDIVRLPESLDVLVTKFQAINAVLINEVSLPGVIIGLGGLILATTVPIRRKAGITFLIAAATAYLFDVLLFNDILAPVVVPTTLSLAFGWILFSDILIMQTRIQRYAQLCILPVALLFGSWLIAQNFGYVFDVAHDPTGLETIALAENAPPGSTLMLPWGTRYFAIGFAQDVLGKLQHLHRADDKADVAALLAQNPLVVPEFMVADYPVSWFEAQLKQKVYVRAAGPHLVQIDTAPQIIATNALPGANIDSELPVQVYKQNIQCSNDRIVLQVDWLALKKPPRDFSIFVHWFKSDGTLLAQSDQSAPVYSWRPLTSWEAGELVHDIYPLQGSVAARVEFGFYEQLANGEFKNYAITTLPVKCNNQ